VRRIVGRTDQELTLVIIRNHADVGEARLARAPRSLAVSHW